MRRLLGLFALALALTGPCWAEPSATPPALSLEALPPVATGQAPVLTSLEHPPCPPIRLPRPVTIVELKDPIQVAPPSTGAAGAEPVFAPPPPPTAVLAGRAATAPSAMPPMRLSKGALALVTSRGTSFHASSRAGVLIPEGAAVKAFGLSLMPEDALAEAETLRRAQAADRKALSAVEASVAFGPEGTRFAKAVTLELPYARSRLPAGVVEAELVICYWNAAAGEWEPLASQVDTQAQVVRAQTDHFSSYQLLAPAHPAAAGGPVALLGESFFYPNPVGPGQTARLRVYTGADHLEIRVYDVAGGLVHSAAYDKPAQELDHVWDVSGVGSGVYTYSITAARAGEATARATGKVGVIR